MTARVEELERMVRNARIDVQTAERLVNEYARGLHLARTILTQREEQLATAKHLEVEEQAAKGR